MAPVAAIVFAGALAVSSVTFLVGAGREAVREGETTPEDPTAVVRIDAPGSMADEALAFFAQVGARSTHVVDHPVPRVATDEVEPPRAFRPPRSRSEQKSQSDAGFRPDLPHR